MKLSIDEMEKMMPYVYYDLIELYNEEIKRTSGEKNIDFNLRG